jgi:hypothetical protein
MEDFRLMMKGFQPTINHGSPSGHDSQGLDHISQISSSFFAANEPPLVS